MKPAVRTGAGEDPVTLVCLNCGHTVQVAPSKDIASCINCAHVWNWKRKDRIRGQR